MKGSPLKILEISHLEFENRKTIKFCVSQIWFYYYIFNKNFWLFLAFSKQSKQKCWTFSTWDQRHDGFHTGFHTKWWISIDFAMKRWNFFILLASKNCSNFLETYSFRTSNPALKRPWPETFKNWVYYCKFPPETSHRGPSSWSDIGKIHFHHPKYSAP